LRLAVAGWGLALLAILISGLAWPWKAALVLLAVTLALVSHRRQRSVRAISISEKRCTLRLSHHQTLELAPPYRATPLIWWVSIHYQDGFAGRWFWLYRDQFSDDEWRQLMVLLRWPS
jgi:hypothetical protein